MIDAHEQWQADGEGGRTTAVRVPPLSPTGRRLVPRAVLVLPLLALFALITAAQCYPSGTRVVVFVQGIYTTYDASGTEQSVLEGQRFNVIKNAFLAKGYDRKALLDFSYDGGTVGVDGAWHPKPYVCEDTDRAAAANLAMLEDMLRQYRQRHKNTHFTLVGHSLGGYLAFLEGAREAARADADRLGIDVVVTIDAPLKGVSVDKKAILDLVPCDKTYVAGAELVAQRNDPTTPDVRRYQAGVMAQQGIRLATLGNLNDCLYNTNHCVPGATFIDDSGTQFLDGQAALSKAYMVDSLALLSHDALLGNTPAMRDAVAFVGAP